MSDWLFNAIAISPDGGSFYITDVYNHTVNQYDIGTGGALTPKSTPTVPADLSPATIAISPPRSFDVTAELGISDTSQCLPTQDYVLQPNTEYTVRLCARDASHERWNCGGNRTFTTDPV